MDAENLPPLRQRQTSELSQLRKVNKPLMEKRRRERINNCLEELKSMLTEFTKKEQSYYSRLEKADILEMTVKYLKNSKRTKLADCALKPHDQVEVLNKYNAGFKQCAEEVSRCLNSVNGVTPEMRTTLLDHLNHHLQSQKRITNIAPRSTTTVLTSAPTSTSPTLLNQTSNLVPCSMQFLPATLPSGDVVLVLTNPTQTGSNINLFSNSISANFSTSTTCTTSANGCSGVATTRNTTTTEKSTKYEPTSPVTSQLMTSSQSNQNFDRQSSERQRFFEPTKNETSRLQFDSDCENLNNFPNANLQMQPDPMWRPW